MVTRAFPQGVARLIERNTIVKSAEDIRRVTTQCLADGTPCTLELGDNIVCSAGFTIPGGLKAFSVDGAQRFKLIVSGDLPFLFYAKGAESNDGCPVEVSNVEILVKEGSTLTTAFIVEQFRASFSATTELPALSVRNVFVRCPTVGAISNLFGHGQAFGGTARAASIVVEGVDAIGVLNVLALDDQSATYYASSIDHLLVRHSSAGTATLGQGTLSATFIGTISNVLGDLTISLGDSSEAFLVSINVTEYVGNNGNNTLCRVNAFPRTVGPNEVDLDNISGGGGGGGTFGQATATFTVGLDSVTVSVVDAGVTSGSNIVLSVGTAPGREADEYTFAPVHPVVASVTAGVGFDILVVCPDADADGAYLINYTRD